VDVDRSQLPDGSLRAVQTADDEAVDAYALSRTVRFDVALRLPFAGATRSARDTPATSASRLPRVLTPFRRRQRQTPFGETTIPPHLARRSSPLIRRGPNPG
jgi:hypothetical protein